MQTSQINWGLDVFANSLADLEQTMFTINVKENEVLANKKSDKNELTELFAVSKKMRFIFLVRF